MTVKLERIEHSLGRITLANPPANNLDRPDFLNQATLDNFLGASDLKGVVVIGQGRHFCAGADLSALKRQQHDGESFLAALRRGKAILESLNRATVPIVAAIRGSCLGAGLELALACHFRIATPTALLGFPESQHGFLPGMGGTVFSHQNLAFPAIIDLVLSGRCLLGPEAQERGMVDRIVDISNLETQAIAYLVELTGRHSPRLIRSALASIHDGRFLPRAEALEQESRRFFELIQDVPFDD